MRFFKHFKFARCLYLVTMFASSTVGTMTFANDASAQTDQAIKNSFNDIQRAVFSDPYDALPKYKVTKKLFGKSGDHPDNHVLRAARRSLTSTADLFDFPLGQKVFQPNGICFAGHWLIESDSEYTGLFEEGTRVPVIARASVALGGTLQKHKRAFGMAVKLFPHPNPDFPAKTANLFVMNSLGGVKTQHVLDLSMDNAPALGALPPMNKWGTMLRLQRDFAKADRELSGDDSEIAYRPVDALANINSRNGNALETVYSPTWVRLSIDKHIPRMDQDDFRNELRVNQYPEEKLVWHIDVAPGEISNKKQARWQRIGRLELTSSITSKTCDQRLHFQHPLGQ